MANIDDSENGPARDRHAVAGLSSASSEPVEICVGCNQPLIRRGPKGECLRCLMAFVFPPEDEESPGASSNEEPAGKSALRYGHFEIDTGADGHPVELGAGAMATTYRARDSVLHSAVALKVINQKVAEHPAARARFLREARAAARLHHPNVASVTHYGEQNGECYYAMELVEGETLEARVRREGPLPPALALEIGVQVARALAAAETCGVVHRDLKPSNIMLTTAQGEKSSGGGGSASMVVKVIDWGLAKAMSAESALGVDHTHGGFVGTPAFASPEQFSQAKNRPLDTRSDIYSLGVTLWYLLCGWTPFTGTTLEEIHSRQARNALPLEQLAAACVPGRIVALLKSMLAADLAARPQSARELIEALRGCQEQFPFEAGPPRARRRQVRRFGAVIGLLLVLAACAVLGWEYSRRTPPAPMDRSIAVLPFENLSPDPADAFFTVGVQDEITADLAHIASLKVVGSDSTRSYPVGTRDFARISRELGVWHLLEGSVRREGGQVHVTVRLVDVHDPAHPWSSQYDRRLTDVFAVQGEITRAVADRLHVALSESQKAAIDEPPTSDLAAYDLYLRAREVPRATTRSGGKDIFVNAERAVRWLNEAVARDPKFSLVYCELARRHDELYFYRGIGPPEDLLVDHRSLAEMALAKATRLRPNSGALHLSLAIHALQVTHDPEQAEIEVELARQSLPNSAQVEVIAGRAARRLDRWDEAVRCQERAVSLEPRDTELRNVLATTYHYLRRYDDLDRMMASITALTPSGELGTLPLDNAWGQTERTADFAPLREALLSPAAAQYDEKAKRFSELTLAVWTRDYDALIRLLSDDHPIELVSSGVSYPREWFAALGARLRGDQETAAKCFAVARVGVEKTMFSHPYQGRPLSLLAIIDAGLGRKAQAIEEAKRACDLTPFSTLNLSAPVVRCNLAVVYAWTGENDLAFAELDKLIDRPAGDENLFQPSYGDLRLNPLWDPLRGDPRFEALAKRLAPPPRADAQAKR